MALIDLTRSMISFADKFTAAQGFQATVTHEAFVSQTGKGDRTYGSPTPRQVLVLMEEVSVVTNQGELTKSTTQIVILNAAIVVTDDDRFTMPDGTTQQPIKVRKGFMDPVTKQPILTQVYFG